MNNKRKPGLRQNKKWTEEEISIIVDYLLENRDIEQPTAQIYYENFLDKSKLEVPWILVRWKVRHLKDSFRKAKQMKQSIEAGILKESEKEKLRKLWPHYDKLQELFDGDVESDVADSENSVFNSAIYTITTFEDSNELQIPKIEQEEFYIPNQLEPLVTVNQLQSDDSPNDLQQISNESKLSPLCTIQEPDQAQSSSNEFRENSSEQSTDSAKVTSSAKKRKRPKPKNLIAAFTRSQEVQNSNQRLRLKFEKEKFYKEFEFKKEKFKIEQELRRAELELRRNQIEREENLKIMEMEYQERITKYELDRKYKAR